MASIYIVYEVTEHTDANIYKTAYSTYDKALAALKNTWLLFLQEQDENIDYNGDPITPEEAWDLTVKDATKKGNVIAFYIEKGIFMEIHHLTLD